MQYNRDLYLHLIFVAILGVSVSACSTAPDVSSPLPLGLLTPAPAGYKALCARNPAQCPETQETQGTDFISAAFRVPEQQIALTGTRWDQLNTINLGVNTRVRYVSDQEHYGTTDYWTPATDIGDCKDFALAKRQLLWATGWPVGALSLAIVQSPRTGPHAVLVADTAQGAYVLDNTSPWVLPWSETDYTWIAAQDGEGQWRVAGKNGQAVRLAALATGIRPPVGMPNSSGASLVKPDALVAAVFEPNAFSRRQEPNGAATQPGGG